MTKCSRQKKNFVPCHNFSGYKIKLFIKSRNKEINFETCGCGFTWLIGGRWHLVGKQKLPKKSVTAIISFKRCSRHKWLIHSVWGRSTDPWNALNIVNKQRPTLLGAFGYCLGCCQRVLTIFLLHNSHTLQIHSLKFPRWHEVVPREIETMPMQIFGSKRGLFWDLYE